MPADRLGPRLCCGRIYGEDNLIRKFILAVLVGGLFAFPTAAGAHNTCRSHRCKVTSARACARDRTCVHRVTIKRYRRMVAPYRHAFFEIGRCESGGHGPRPNWHLPSAGGIGILTSTWTNPAYRGTQFAPLPYEASALEQMVVGVRILHDAGWGAWACAGWRFQ